MHLVLVTSALLALPAGTPSSTALPSPSEPTALPASPAAGTETGRQATLYFGDVDGDGLDDVFAIDAEGKPGLLLNEGQGRYQDITLPSGLGTIEFATCALLADLDGDGDRDLFVGSSDVRVWRNLGNALFEPVVGVIDHDLIDLEADAIDRDGDGLLDLQIQTEAGDLLYRSTGRGGFEHVALTELPAARSPSLGGTPVADAAVPTDADQGAGDEPPARRRLRRWLDARRLNAATPSIAAPTTTPGSSGGTSPLIATCTPWMQNQATGGCLFASSAPTLGMLYPMSPALNVDTNGRVGIGTTTPISALTVVAQNSSNISALSGNNAVHAGINVGRTAPEFAMGISSSNGNWLAGSSPGDGILRVNDSAKRILLGFGIGGPATMAVTNGNVGIGTTTPEAALDVKNGSLWVSGATGGNLAPSAGRGLRLFHEGGLDKPIIQGMDWATLFGIDLLIQPDGGNVGIGTLTPTKKLDVAGDTAISGRLGVGTTNPTSKLHAAMDAFDNGLTLENTTDSTRVLLIPPSITGGFSGGVGTDSALDFPLFTNNLDRVTVKADGKVGIGTSNPFNTLSVASGEIQLYGSGGQPKAVMGRSLTNSDRGRMFILDETFTIRAGMDFSGNNSTVFANVKNFREPNPDDASTDLVYACVEGPEAAMYVRGTATLTAGHVVVDLPRHFAAMAAAEAITVQLTPLSPMSRGLCVVRKSTDSFDVRELMNGSGTYEFDWEVKAIRRGYEDYEVVRPKLTYEEQIGPADATQPKVATYQGKVAKK